MVETPPAVETKPKIYSVENISQLLMSGQAKTVTEAKAILQAQGYISPLQAFKGETGKPLVPPEAKNVKYEFKPAEGEKVSPLLPRGSTRTQTYGFRVYPPYLPFKVIRGQQRQGGKMLRRNVWDYFERRWNILGMHEFAKLFIGGRRKR